MITRLLSRLRRPPFLGWGGDYRGDLTFMTCWNPDPNGEIR